jgi:uncharacterized protein (TIGR04255 family)
MKTPQAHNFSRSPVEEVYGSCTTSSGRKSAITVLAPYPGWSTIRNDLSSMIKKISDPVVTSCTLRYTDRFHPFSLDDVSGPLFLGSMSCGKIHSRIEKRTEDLFLMKTNIPDSTASVRFITGGSIGQGSTLIFTISSTKKRLVNDKILTWFDAAHDDIHDLFDICVPEELISTLK